MSADDFNFPVIVTSAGMQPQDQTAIRDQILAQAIAGSPGLTGNLPGILIEDILSTDVPAVSLADAARVEAVNSLTPNGANEALLLQLGQLYGVKFGQPSNTSVFVVFSSPQVGYVIPAGFIVGDTAGNVYQTTSVAVIQSGGSSLSVNAVSIQAGSFSVGVNTVVRNKTSVPSVIQLTVTNPTIGTPGSASETWASFRARVMQAGVAACVGSARFIKTLIDNVPGVQKGKTSVVPVSGGLLRVIIAGNGDPFNIALALFMSVDNPAELTGSAISGGRNITASLIDPPNTYAMLYVNAPQQTVTLAITWNTTLSNFTNGGSFAGLVQPVLVAYINAIANGAPINVLEMDKLFQDAVSSVLDPDFLTRLVFAVSINGSVVAPGTGTAIVVGDAESYFFTAADGSGITVTQG